MEQMKSMKQCLLSQAQAQMGNLQNVDAEELGEVIDMIKDLEEAIYYCTITEAMNKKKEEPTNYYYTEKIYPQYDWNREREMDMMEGKMYYSSSSGGKGSGGGMSNGSNGSSGGNSGSRSYYTERDLPLEFRDAREGRSPLHRKMYMESKDMDMGKEKRMKELEEYLQELSADITEMVKGASPEEKQLLQKKIAVLATKVNV